MPICIKFESIKGQCTTGGYTHWITLGSCQMGAGRAIASAKGRGANREGSEPGIREVVVTKEWDAAASSKLFEEAVCGLMDRRAEIHFTTIDAKKQQPFLVMKLGNACISSYSLSSPGEGKPMESLSLNFPRIEIVPTIVDEKLGTKDGEKVPFNLETMQANA